MDQPGHAPDGKARAGLIAGVVLVFGLLVLMRWLPLSSSVEALKTWIQGLGLAGPLIYGLIYVVATVCMVPGLILTIAAGALFGLGPGFVVVSVASTTGAALAFLIARYLVRSRIAAIANRHPKFAAVDAAIAEGDWRVVGLLRLSPAIPFNLQNYLYGLTGVRFWPYVAVSWIAMMPGTLLYVYLGFIAGEASGESSFADTGRWVLLVAGLLATVIATWYITRLARRRLAARNDRPNGQQACP